METASLKENIQYHESRPVIQVLLDTDAGKEIRIVFKKGQVMKEHKAPFPIVVEVFEGCIDFEVSNDIMHTLKEGDLITLKENVVHELIALKDSIVRLSLNKFDTTKRVQRATSK